MDLNLMVDPVFYVIVLLIRFCAVLVRAHVGPQISEYMASVLILLVLSSLAPDKLLSLLPGRLIAKTFCAENATIWALELIFCTKVLW